MLSEGVVGPRRVAPFVQSGLRQGSDGELIVGDGHGRYYEACRQGNLYLASNQAGVAAPAGLTTASLNFTLHNPLGSGVNLVLLNISGQATLDPAADAAVWLVANPTLNQVAPATVTALTVRNALLGNAAGKGLAYSTATLAAAPVVIRPLAGVPWATAAGFAQVYINDDVAGSIIIPPSIYVSIQASAAITLAAAMIWEEVAI